MALTKKTLDYPLDDQDFKIRLLVLEPSQTADSPLASHLLTTYIQSTPPYEILSYYSGNSNRTKSIRLSGHSFRIRPNLEAALKGVRLEDAQRAIWVDVLCINENSLFERNRHAIESRRIYSQCAHNLVWLGPYPEEHDSFWGPNPGRSGTSNVHELNIGWGFNLMNRMANKDISTLDGMAELWKHHFEDVNQAKYSASKATYLLPHEDLVSLYDTFLQPTQWFNTWIVQQLSLAPRIWFLAGRYLFDWKILSDFLEDSSYVDAFRTWPHFYGYNPRSGPLNKVFKPLRNLKDQRRIIREAGQEGIGLNLVEVLERFRYVGAKDHRDRIFGLLGLATDHQRYQVDYGKSLEQIYICITVSHINTSRNLDLIYQSSWQLPYPFIGKFFGSLDLRVDLASWTANFLASISILKDNIQSNFKSGKAECRVPCRILRESLLAVRGVVLGHIGPIHQSQPGIGHTRRTNYNEKPDLHVPLALLDLYLGHDILLDSPSEHKYINGESALTAFWRTLVMDCSGPSPGARLSAQEVHDEEREVRDAWLYALNREEPEFQAAWTGIFGFKVREHEAQRPVVDQYYSNPAIQQCWDWSHPAWAFALTTNGLYTLVKQPMREGDAIVCVEGARMPLLLRPVQHEVREKVYKVISVAYVHGLMDGEVGESTELREKLQLMDETFWLA